MLNMVIVRDALKRCLAQEDTAEDRDSLVSMLIHDYFGGEILKTRKKRGWHFYNRVDGLRIDLTRPEIDNSDYEKGFEDIPATPDETYCYFEQDEYNTFLFRFIRAFEEAVGLDKSRPVYSA
jgi:hypothetical protein